MRTLPDLVARVCVEHALSDADAVRAKLREIEYLVDQLYSYNLAVPSNATAGQLFTILIRPFGGSTPTLYAVLKIKK